VRDAIPDRLAMLCAEKWMGGEKAAQSDDPGNACSTLRMLRFSSGNKAASARRSSGDEAVK